MEIYIFFDILNIAYSFVTVMIFKSLLLLILFFPVWFSIMVFLLGIIRQIRKRYFYESYLNFEKQNPVAWRNMKTIALVCALMSLIVYIIIDSQPSPFHRHSERKQVEITAFVSNKSS